MKRTAAFSIAFALLAAGCSAADAQAPGEAPGVAAGLTPTDAELLATGSGTPCDDLAADWDHDVTIGVPDGIEFPAEVWDDYEFSTDPLCDAEEWLQSAYPKLWEQGARAVAHDGVFWDWDIALENMDLLLDGARDIDTLGTAPTAQYIDGVRYEGTGDMPLGFDGWGSPDEFQTQFIDAQILKLNSSPSLRAIDLPNTGHASYHIFISSNDGFKRGVEVGIGDSNDTTLSIWAQGVREADEDRRRFADWQEALTWVLTTDDLSPSIEGARALYPGEIAAITLTREEKSVEGHNSFRHGLYHPDTHQIEWMNADRMPVLSDSQRFETFNAAP